MATNRIWEREEKWEWDQKEPHHYLDDQFTIVLTTSHDFYADKCLLINFRSYFSKLKIIRSITQMYIFSN